MFLAGGRPQYPRQHVPKNKLSVLCTLWELQANFRRGRNVGATCVFARSIFCLDREKRKIDFWTKSERLSWTYSTDPYLNKVRLPTEACKRAVAHVKPLSSHYTCGENIFLFSPFSASTACGWNFRPKLSSMEPLFHATLSLGITLS